MLSSGGIDGGLYCARGRHRYSPKNKETVANRFEKQWVTSSMQELLERHAEEMKDLTAEEKWGYAFTYMFYNQAAVGKVMHDWHIEHVTLSEPKEQMAANKALEGFDFRNDLKNVAARTLVISGKYDGLNPPERGKEIAALIPDSTFVEFEYSGHAPSIEEPERFIKEITSFFLSEPG
nr:alpha/beta fold hydrolase [Cohnella pontilimi]